MKFNDLIPELSVSNINESKKFYTDVLEFHLEYERLADKFAFLSYGETQIMIEEINEHWKTGILSYPFGRGINFQISVDNIDELYKNIKVHNYPIKIEIQDNWYRANNKLIGQKEFLIMDPDGYLLRFAQDLGEKECEAEGY